MSHNDITGDSLTTRAPTDKYRDGWDRVFKKPPYRCTYCGAPSWVHPCDQEPPPDYCHESDHGEPE